MLTSIVLDAVTRSVEHFSGAKSTTADASAAIARLVVMLCLIWIAALMARGCKDYGLNIAVTVIDPIAYILARLVFGRCTN